MNTIYTDNADYLKSQIKAIEDLVTKARELSAEFWVKPNGMNPAATELNFIQDTLEALETKLVELSIEEAE